MHNPPPPLQWNYKWICPCFRALYALRVRTSNHPSTKHQPINRPPRHPPCPTLPRPALALAQRRGEHAKLSCLCAACLVVAKQIISIHKLKHIHYLLNGNCEYTQRLLTHTFAHIPNCTINLYVYHVNPIEPHLHKFSSLSCNIKYIQGFCILYWPNILSYPNTQYTYMEYVKYLFSFALSSKDSILSLYNSISSYLLLNLLSCVFTPLVQHEVFKNLFCNYFETINIMNAWVPHNTDYDIPMGGHCKLTVHWSSVKTRSGRGDITSCVNKLRLSIDVQH